MAMNYDDFYDMADKLPFYRAPDPWEGDRDILRHVYWRYKLLPMRGKIVKLRKRRTCRRSRRKLWM